MTDPERAYLDGRGGISVSTLRRYEVVELPEYRSRLWSKPQDVKVADGSNLCSVPGCTKPAGDAFVCAHCLDDLDTALGNVPGLLEDLEVLLTRQHRLPRREVERTRAEHTRWDPVIRDRDFEGNPQGRLLAAKGFNRVPYVPKASQVSAELGSAVVTAVRSLCEHRGLPLPALDVVRASRWLLTNLRSVALDPAGGDIVAEITGAAGKAMRTIDRPEDAERVYIGICANEKCRAAMYADPGKPEHRCTTCGETYEVAERLREQTARFDDKLLTTSELHIYAKMAGGNISLSGINRLVAARRVVKVSENPAGRALYRSADLLVVLNERERDREALDNRSD